MKELFYTKIDFDFGRIDEKLAKVLRLRRELAEAVYELREAVDSDILQISIKKEPDLLDTDKAKTITKT